MRLECIKTIDEELQDVSKLRAFKNIRLTKAEQDPEYPLCERIMEKIMSLRPKSVNFTVRSDFLKESRNYLRDSQTNKSRVKLQYLAVNIRD